MDHLETTDPPSAGKPLLSPHLASRAHLTLRRHKEEIIVAWERWLRDEVEAVSLEHSVIVRDHLPAWLDELILTLDPEGDGRLIDTGNSVSQRAGLHRAVQPGYTLASLLKEYSLLRKAIIMVLEDDEPLDPNDREIIAEAVDTSLSLAANEFAEYQRSQIQVALHEAERSNRDLENVASIAAHDLKSPLATITGYLDLMDLDIREHCPNSSELIEITRRQSTRMSTLIDRLMTYATVRSQKPEFTDVDLTDVANVAMENLKTIIGTRNAAVYHAHLPTVRGDVSLLIQLFQNLIANGIKFNRSEMPEVTISCTGGPNLWILEFHDNGIGFDAKHAELMFQPYCRLNQDEFQGSGLGLATVQRVVDLHHGKIKACATLGGGASFTVELPA